MFVALDWLTARLGGVGNTACSVGGITIGVADGIDSFMAWLGQDVDTVGMVQAGINVFRSGI